MKKKILAICVLTLLILITISSNVIGYNDAPVEKQNESKFESMYRLYVYRHLANQGIPLYQILKLYEPLERI